MFKHLPPRRASSQWREGLKGEIFFKNCLKKDDKIVLIAIQPYDNQHNEKSIHFAKPTEIDDFLIGSILLVSILYITIYGKVYKSIQSF